MAARTVDGPEGVYVTATAAAAYLGISAKTFARYAEELPWLRPVPIRGKLKWHWEDVYCLGHILRRLADLPTGPAAEEIQKKADSAGVD